MMAGDTSSKIAALEKKIHNIEDAIKQKLKEKQHRKKWRKLQNKETNEEFTPDVEDLKLQIKQLESLNDVKFHQTDVQILEQGYLWSTKRMGIKGICMDEEFLLVFEVKDSMNEEGSMRSEITALEIKLVTSKDTDFMKHIEQLEEEKNVQGFFMLLRSYTKWAKLRDVTFQHFLSNFPETTSLRSKHCLQLKHLEKPCVFHIDWSTGISSYHECFPAIQLSVQVKGPSSSDELINSAPDMFQLMLKELGIEKTFNSFVTLCSK